MAKKLINATDILDNLVNTLTPNYFPENALDKNRVSIYGYITEAMANSIEDTVTLEQRRAADYCPELSNNEIYVREVATIRDVDITRATPGKCFAIIGVLKNDILNKGDTTGDTTTFIIDRRSTILYNNINFSLEDDIIIRAMHKNGELVYTANYTGDHSNYESYIQVFNQVNNQGEEMVVMICQIYQFNYNIQEKIVTDSVEFLYDGISYDYDNILADFEVYYKQTGSDTFTQVSTEQYLSRTSNKSIYYDDSDANILKILNNPVLNIMTNATIRVEMKETLGTNGNITLSDKNVATFSLYKDSSYNYSGVNILINIVSDTVNATDGDNIIDIRTNLINEKTMRNNITTEHDIVTYINDIDANIQIIKKRNDIIMSYYMYTLMRYGDNQLAPATTKSLIIKGLQSPTDIGDFDVYEQTVDRKIIQAYSKFALHIVDGFPDNDYVTKVPHSENLPDTYYLISPYMILINEYNIASYYFTSVDDTVILSTVRNDNGFPYQIICRTLDIYRNSHNADTHDTYTVKIKGTMNTASDEDLVDSKTGEIIDKTSIQAYLVFNNDTSPVGYLSMNIDSYNADTREFLFTGSFKTNDYITDDDKLLITDGLHYIKSGDPFDSVINYKDGTFELYFMYKYNDSTNSYPKTNVAYTTIPSADTSGYVLMNSYTNGYTIINNEPSINYYNLILEFNKFSRTPVIVTRTEKGVDGAADKYQYTLKEVPFFEYNFGLKYTASLYSKFLLLYKTYSSLITLTTGFEVSLKFIATYGNSKYITVTGGRSEDGKEIVVPLNDLTPTFYFKVYGKNVDISSIQTYIYKYLRDTYITGNKIFISNICTLVEGNFTNVKSIKYLGVNKLDASYQEFTYNKPDFIDVDVITKFIPEQLNVTDIQISLDET